jgi:hypothetical protein
MGRDDEPEHGPEVQGALWGRMKWLRLSLGAQWPPGGHVAAQNEWLRLDALPIPDAKRVARLRSWLLLTGWNTTEEIDDEMARLGRVAARFGGCSEPVRRLRIVEPEGGAQKP